MISLDPGSRALLAVVLAVAATSKVRSRAAFLDLVPDLARYGLPAPLVRPWVAAAVVALEGGAVLLLAAPAAGYLVAGSLGIGFSAGTARVLRRGVRATCRCFGGAETPIDSTHLVRNLLLVLVAAVGGWARIALPAPTTWSAAAGAVVVGAGIGAAITRYNDLAALVLGPALPLPTGDER